MSKGDPKTNKEKRKPKADAKKDKTPGYMSSGGISAGKPAPFSIGSTKKK